MTHEEVLSAQIGESMLNTLECRTFKPPTFAHRREAIIAKMMHRFGEQYPHDMIWRVAEVEFEIVLEVIKPGDLLYNYSK
jgi:hypothetical protein